VFDKVIFTIGEVHGASPGTGSEQLTFDMAVHITLGNTVEPESAPPEPHPPLKHRPPAIFGYHGTTGTEHRVLWFTLGASEPNGE